MDTNLSVQFDFLLNPTDEQVIQITKLYQMAGWWSYETDNPELIKKIISGTHCFLAAIIKDKIIGMGRGISDRTSDAYIQDVTVAPELRGKGIGTNIIKIIMNRLVKDGIKWIGLIAERDSHGFYEKIGFSPMKNSMPMLKIIL